jgi:hypothetical protein
MRCRSELANDRRVANKWLNWLSESKNIFRIFAAPLVVATVHSDGAKLPHQVAQTS